MRAGNADPVARPSAATTATRATTPARRYGKPSGCTYLDGYVTLWVPMVVDAVLHAVADGHRRTMLERLRDRPATVNELAATVPIARPGVSRHLRVLREAGLVEVRREAQRRIYSLRPQPLAEIDDWLGHYRGLWQHRMAALHTEVARGQREREPRP